MKTTYPLRTLTLAAGLLAATVGTSTHAQEYALRFQHSDQAGNPNYVIGQEWAASLMERSGGRLSLELLPVGSIVEYQETQDAVGAGIIDGHVTDASYFAGKDPAFSLIGNPVGAWSAPQQMLDYINKGGGKELMNELVQPYGLQFIGATTPGLEAFVSKVPIDSVADLKGLKMRAPEGLVNQVFAAAGATPVNLPSSEVFTSLDKGVIDAADFSVFSTNQAQGLNDIAKHPIYPGFHSMPLIEISMNKAKWDSMPEDLQTLLEESVLDFSANMVSQLAANDEKAVAEAAEKGITIHDWSDEERAKFRGIAAEKWVTVAEKSPNAQKVYDHLTAYLKQEGLIK
ncbi:TRAP transporter substrate-binding protein [Granulosicoccus sp. 3-233]|uniref:TRAP transporter substrate-binding protein n=1 Tax=Granulosicoccus sp. 3-233 TaxID=3417969 RepID=UPI003D352863